MKKFNSNSIVAALAVSLVIALAGPIVAFAATSPSLGTAKTYGLLSTTYTDPITPLASTINGDVGFTLAGTPAQAPVWAGTNYGPVGPYGPAVGQAGGDQGVALVALNLGNPGTCDFIFAPGAINLATDMTHVIAGFGSVMGEYIPGIYCTGAPGAATVGTAGITLKGAGTYIFRINGALNSVADSLVTLASGASACDVFWVPTAATTIGAYTGALPNTTKLFIGTIIDDAGISLGANSSLLGRALSFASTVTLGDNATINVPSCPTGGGGGGLATGNINVVKTVINDNGGTKVVADFPLFVNGTPVVSGVTNAFPAPAGVYTVTETSNSQYTRTFSGDCDATGTMNLSAGDNRFCIITNNDIGPAIVVPPVPPLIDVVKVPSPLALPAGPGLVKYTYTVHNIGTVPMTNITMVGDSCSPITLISGDTNSNAILEVTETWVYTCSTNLPATHTNTVVATGWANGISAVDIASATVVVGVPLVPPLIHVTKVPNPLALTNGGGMVTYTEKITNPGTVALSNVTLTDNKCAPMVYVSGDTNADLKLDKTETWTFTCKTNLTVSTTNTATATGTANGITVRDFALATVIVSNAPLRGAAPKLPNTGVDPTVNNFSWPLAAAGLSSLSLLFLVILKKQTK